MQAKYPAYSSLWLKSLEEFGEDWEKEISINITKVFGETFNHKWEEAVRGYAEFCTEALRAQVFFEKHGHYKASSYLECVEQCYHNADYMKVRYLPGQYLSHYIWPHHQRMLHHYVNDLLPLIEKEVSLFYEVGVGCGLYSQKTLEKIPNVKGIGIDISDYALEFTHEVVKLHGMADRYKVMNSNIIDSPLTEKADFVISQEVLEHLENPEAFIAGLFEATRYGGWGYITAAINAAHTDHIYLYRSTEEVQKQIESVGWRTMDMQVEENYPNRPKEFRPTIVGFFVKKGKL
jgi:2-polyprenyl-3-methyl-5-hydroxy-6-metoxy-1,4-benzoquinol methylase